MNKADMLSRVPLFATMSPVELEDMARMLEMRHLPKGAVFMEEGHPGNEIYFLLDGDVEVIKFYGKEGERLLGMRGPGSIFGEMSHFSQVGSHTATVRAATPLLVCVLSPEDFEKLLLNRPKAALEMMRILSRRLEFTENEIIQDLRQKNQQLTQAYRELQEAQDKIIEKEKMDHELAMARSIQQSVLPRILPILPEVQLGALMEPARQMGGDFYDFFLLSGDQVGVVVGDVSDKGMPAAFVMALVYSLIRAEACHPCSPAQVLVAANDHLINMGVTDMFATVIYGIYSRDIGRFTFARAGHPMPIILDQDAGVLPMSRSVGQPIGIFSPVALDVQTVTIPPGGVMLLFSDGLIEVMNKQGEPLEVEGAEQALRKCFRATAQEICEHMLQVALNHAGSSVQQDDIALVCLKRRG